MKFSSLVHLLWGLLCFAGNVFHVYWISSKFFEYDVATNVQLYFPDKIDTPSILMCFDTMKLFKWGSMSVSEKEKLLTSESTPIFSKLKNRPLENVTAGVMNAVVTKISTIKERENFIDHLDNISIPTADLFRLTRNRSELYKFTTLDPINKVFDDQAIHRKLVTERQLFQSHYKYKCFEFEHQDRVRTHDYVAVRDTNHFKKVLATAVFDEHRRNIWKDIGDIRYFLSPPGYDNTDMTEHVTIKVSCQNKDSCGSQFQVTYTVYRTTLLPPPYPTKCRNYKREGVSSQRGCYRRCLKEVTMFKEGKLHPDSWLIHPEDDNKPLMKRGVKLEDIERKCSKYCQQKECSTYIYVPRIMVSEKAYEQSFKKFEIKQLISMVPVIQADSMERIVLVQYLTDLSSSLGFWLGLSALGVAEMFGGFVKSVFEWRKGRRLERDFVFKKKWTKEDQDIRVIKRNFRAIQSLMKTMKAELNVIKKQELQGGGGHGGGHSILSNFKTKKSAPRSHRNFRRT